MRATEEKMELLTSAERDALARKYVEAFLSGRSFTWNYRLLSPRVCVGEVTYKGGR